MSVVLRLMLERCGKNAASVGASIVFDSWGYIPRVYAGPDLVQKLVDVCFVITLHGIRRADLYIA